ncbi:MAG: DUF2189 domain-containing protein [Pseudomonadota bacterium]
MIETDQDQLPFVAPCRTIPTWAALGWLGQAWADYRANVRVSVCYGLLVFLISLAVSALAWWLGRYVLVVAMLSGFVIIVPLLATGLYSVSRQHARGEAASFARSIQRMRHALRDSMVYALILLVIFLVWVRAGAMVHVFFPIDLGHGGQGLWLFLTIGSAVGSMFALISFATSAFSLPMIVDRNADMVTACVTSIHAVLRNKRAMLVWIGLIVSLTGLGFVTAGLGLVMVIPLLAYATYHGYLETIDSEAWPPSPG